MAEKDRRFPVAVLTRVSWQRQDDPSSRLLTEPGMARTAVLINEFGEIGLDHLLVRSVIEDAVILQNGCICCTLTI